MSERKVVVVDVKNLAYRIYHATGRNSGAVFPAFQAKVKRLEEEFSPCSFTFCSDSRRCFRKEEFPWYKENRKSDPEAAAAVGDAVSDLRNVYKNDPHYPFYTETGLEADDLIAKAVQMHHAMGLPCVMVSSDQDLFQCLRRGISQYLPGKNVVYTDVDFREDYGIPPSSWHRVKAIAGCVSDSVPGLAGVGVVTACKYVAGVLPSCPTKDRIRQWTLGQQYKDNLKVCTLPLNGKRIPIKLPTI